jgi:2-polyprenyl-3-methyl-5-hydroxy-6-metoxy-1,4-benzoquinol methylase
MRKEMICPLCSGPCRRMPEHPEAELYRCLRCTHAFTIPESLDHQEQYAASYFLEDHRRWFENPNVRLFEQVLNQIPVGASVVDVGCGRGDFLRFARETRGDLKLTGIDLSQNPNERGIRYFQGDILNADINERFDAVVSLLVIEHIAEVKTFTRRMGELVHPAAILVIVTINDGSILYLAARAGKAVGIPLAFNRLYSRHHLHHFTRKSLHQLMSGNGFAVEQHWDHNAPIEAMDLPVKSRTADFILRAGLRLVWGAGKVTGRSYLQTVVCRVASAGSTSGVGLHP